MSNLFEVQSFLNDFKIKMSVLGIVFRDERSKNAQTLLTLDITVLKRKEILNSLVAKDYCQGPLEEKLYGGKPYVGFWKNCKQKGSV